MIPMIRQRDKEGVYTLDHSQTQGIPDATVMALGLPPGAGQGLFEAPTYTCSHCQFVVVLNPKRNRDRAYCRGCDHLICDACGVVRAKTFACKTFKQVVDEILTQAERQADGLLILP